MGCGAPTPHELWQTGFCTVIPKVWCTALPQRQQISVQKPKSVAQMPPPPLDANHFVIGCLRVSEIHA